MKNILILAILLLGATTAFAANGDKSWIFVTPHNLSSQPIGGTDPYVDTVEDQLCVFCHTPHGGTLDAPLWNRDLSSLQGASVFQHYASNTLSSTVGAASRAVNAESLTCLSCHDGSISVGDSLVNASVNGTPSLVNTDIVLGLDGGPGARTGASRALMDAGDLDPTGDLRDDHPISFSYTLAYGDPTNTGDLKLATEVEAAGLTLFGTGKNVECATCHDPHVNYIQYPEFTPFLAMTNSGSAMCLSCHIK